MIGVMSKSATKRKANIIFTKTKKGAFSGRARPTLLSSLILAVPPSGRSTISSKPSHSSSSVGGVGVVILPTLVSPRKVRTARVARSSWKSSLIVGPHGRFRSQGFPMLPQSSFIWVAQARHLTNGWWRDSRSPLPHSTGYGMKSRRLAHWKSLKQVLLFAGHMAENRILTKVPREGSKATTTTRQRIMLHNTSTLMAARR